MSPWMFLPFALGVLSYVGVSIFKKIREKKVDVKKFDEPYTVVGKTLPDSWKYTAVSRTRRPLNLKIKDEDHKTGIPAIADGKAVAGENNFISGKERLRDLQAEAMKDQNPCGEIPLGIGGEMAIPQIHYGHQFVQNESTANYGGLSNVSSFKLLNWPIPGTTTGTIYIGNKAAATFVAQSNGNLCFTPIGNTNAPIWGHCSHNEFQFEFSSPPGLHHIVCSYETNDVPQTSSGPITKEQWLDVQLTIRQKEFKKTNKDDFWTPKDVATYMRTMSSVVRILPPFNGPFFVARRQHYNVNGCIQCGKKHNPHAGPIPWTGNCPICDHHQKMWNNRSHRAEANKFKPTERYYYNVLVDGKPMIYGCGKSVHEQIKEGLKNYGDIASPITGRDMIVSRTMKECFGTQFPEYKIEFCDSSNLGTRDRVAEIMSQTYNLERVAKSWEKSNDELVAYLEKMLGNDHVAHKQWVARDGMTQEDFFKQWAASGRDLSSADL